MTKDEALKLALEALESVLDDSPKVLDASISGGLYEVVQCREAITAIKEALAQPVQEPVAWEQFHEHLVERNFCPRCGKRTADPTTIHTCTPPYDNALQRGLARTKEVAAGSQAFYGFPHGPVSTPNAGGKCVTAGETAPKEST